ncbi:MAG: four helix bundle protein [Bacteroidota bacterium]
MAKKIEQFEDLPIWQQAVDIASEVYLLSNQDEWKYSFGIKDQIQRSALSISSNIAEGFEYDNTKDFIRFLRYAKGSAGELRSQLYILYRSEIVQRAEYEALHTKLLEMSRQLSAFMKYLKSRTQ